MHGQVDPSPLLCFRHLYVCSLFFPTVSLIEYVLIWIHTCLLVYIVNFYNLIIWWILLIYRYYQLIEIKYILCWTKNLMIFTFTTSVEMHCYILKRSALTILWSLWLSFTIFYLLLFLLSPYISSYVHMSVEICNGISSQLLRFSCNTCPWWSITFSQIFSTEHLKQYCWISS